MIPNSLIEMEDLTTAQKMVLIVLLRYYNKKKGRAWPSLKIISKDAGISRDWTITTLKQLEDKHFIKKHNNNGNVTQYELLTSRFSRLVNSVDQSTEPTTPVDSVGRVQSTEPTTPIDSVDSTIININNNIQVQKTNTDYQRGDDMITDFKQFWALYPKSMHPDITRALLEYIKLRKEGVSAEELKMAAKHYAEETRGRAAKYIKQCHNFLAEQVWRVYVHADLAPEPELKSWDELYPQSARLIRSMEEDNYDGRQ